MTLTSESPVTDAQLRSRLIRLAHASPELRPDVLSLLVHEPTGFDRQAAKATKLKRDVRLKSGEVVEAGSVATVEFDPDRPSLAILKVEGRDQPVKVSTVNLHAYLAGYKVPPLRATLQRWVEDGVAQTVTGKRVEPDGWGPDGSPSWLLVLGLI